MANHAYWAVECKTPDCETIIYLHYIGDHEPNWIWNVWALDIDPGENGVALNCPCCGRQHRYTKGDIRSVVGPEPTADFRSHPLFAALGSNSR